MVLDQISIELTNYCRKGCWFCYNHSSRDGLSHWTVDDLEALVVDCQRHGLKAVSFGGGEPLEFAGLFDLLERLNGLLFRSITTHGLMLNDELLHRLILAKPDKVHISIHFPEVDAEVERVLRQVQELQSQGVNSGINLLVRRSKLSEARKASDRIRQCNISWDQIVYLPMRGFDTPTPREVAEVAGNEPFQSMSCLTECERSPRFCSVAWDRTVAWCSYTVTRHPLKSLTYAGLRSALDGLGLTFCGGTDASSQNLVGLQRPKTSAAETAEQGDDTANLYAASDISVSPIGELHDAEKPTALGGELLETPNGASSIDVLPEADFPAAHSMDIDIFSLDRDGCVAILSAYLPEDSTPGPAFEHGPMSLRLEKDLGEILGPGYCSYDEFIYCYGYLSSSVDGSISRYGHRDGSQRPPSSPETLRDLLIEVDSRYADYSDYPWMSFDNAAEVTWPPQPPSTIQQWEQLLDDAMEHWLRTLDMLKHAERQEPERIAYWQNLADRQWTSLQRLENDILARKNGQIK